MQSARVSRRMAVALGAVAVAGAVAIAVAMTIPTPKDVMPTILELDGAARTRVTDAAVTSPAVRALAGDRRLRAGRVDAFGSGDSYRSAYVSLELVDGPATLSGDWIRAVVDLPDGSPRRRYETRRESHTVTGLVVGVDLDTTAVRQVLPDPDPLSPTSTAPPRPPGG